MLIVCEKADNNVMTVNVCHLTMQKQPAYAHAAQYYGIYSSYSYSYLCVSMHVHVCVHTCACVNVVRQLDSQYIQLYHLWIMQLGKHESIIATQLQLADELYMHSARLLCVAAHLKLHIAKYISITFIHTTALYKLSTILSLQLATIANSQLASYCLVSQFKTFFSGGYTICHCLNDQGLTFDCQPLFLRLLSIIIYRTNPTAN